MIKKVPPYYISIFLSFLFLIAIFLYYFPGNYSTDSFYTLDQALSGNYFSDHSPMMAWTWSLLIKLTGLFESLFIFHTMALLTAVVCWILVFKKACQGGWISIFFPFFLITPIITSCFAYVWKDVGFAYFMLLGHGVIFLAILARRWQKFFILNSLLLLFYGVLFRLNGYPALIPSIFILLSLTIPRGKLAILKTSMATAFVLVAMLLGSYIFSNFILKATKIPSTPMIKLSDITGISVISGQDYHPTFCRQNPKHNFDAIQYLYKDELIKKSGSVFKVVKKSFYGVNIKRRSKVQKIATSWTYAIYNEPLAYLKHRYIVFNNLMNRRARPARNRERIKNCIAKEWTNYLKKVGGVPYTDVTQGLPRTTPYYITGYMVKLFDKINFFWNKVSGFFNFGWFYFIFLIIQLLLGLFFIKDKYPRIIIITLCSSGLMYIVPYFFIAYSYDFRYLYWSVIVSCFCFPFTFKGIVNRRGSPQPT